ncbi:unnamed protein product [Tetraodon nigroviridis]|uniref:(spotted green pufferfish) hypothetical protein n=1 Tax=Tetraodon nigroviridis TaxID=99883 RepID=Q4SDN1_TETNG|nr:unnamed protein product [Tetraodon nigroviridis]
MPTIVSTVKVTQIIPYLPCLTDHDRENIEAKREMYGNFDSMVLLLDCLKRRENWPEEFISALEDCNYRNIAADIRREYDALRGNANPGSPSAAAVRARIHPVPSASHLPIPERGASSEAAVPGPAETSAPPQPAARASPPTEVPRQPQPAETSAVPSPPPPEPVSHPPQLEVAPVPTTPPASPEIQHAPAGRRPPPPREDTSHQEPVENSEPEDVAVLPDAPQPPSCVERSERDTPAEGEDLRSTAPTAQVPSPPSPPAAEVTSSVACGTTFSVITPNKAPVQDTTPPVLEKEKIPVPAYTQDADCWLQPEAAAAAAMEDSQIENTLCLSNPGELISVQAQAPGGLALTEPDSSMDPYSGNTARLEISSVPESLARGPACSAVTSAGANPSSTLSRQEGTIAVNHNEPEENHYESPGEILESQEIRETTWQICEEPSILNLDGRDATPQGQILNGEAAKEKTSAAAAAAAAAGAESANIPPASESSQLPSPGENSPPAPQDPTKKTSSHFLTTNTKYFVTAAGVGACALLLAWKLKN